MILPPKSNGEGIHLPADVSRITIIGANGSGKTRFTDWLEHSLGESSFHLSALDAICNTSPTQVAGESVDSVYNRALTSGRFLRTEASSMFERLMLLLLNEEMEKLVEYKVSHARGENVALEESKLDVVVRQWQDIFTDNHVLREGGALLFARDGDSSAYGAKRLSHGEKAVLFISARFCMPRLTVPSLLRIPVFFFITRCCADCGIRLSPCARTAGLYILPTMWILLHHGQVMLSYGYALTTRMLAYGIMICFLPTVDCRKRFIWHSSGRAVRLCS